MYRRNQRDRFDLARDRKNSVRARTVRRVSAPRAPPANALVIVVDDDDHERDSLRLLLESVGLTVLTFPNATALLAADPFESHERVCLISDVRLPGMSGMALLERLHEAGKTVPTVMMSGYGDVQTAVRAMKLGAVDFVAKPVDGQVLLDLVQGMLRRLPAERAEPPATEILDLWRTLTPREQDVFRGVTAGRSNKAVAFDLGLSVRTVEAHRARMMRKLGARNLADLVLLAVALRGRHRAAARSPNAAQGSGKGRS